MIKTRNIADDCNMDILTISTSNPKIKASKWNDVAPDKLMSKFQSAENIG